MSAVVGAQDRGDGRNWAPYAVAVAAFAVVAGAGGAATEVGAWYARLRKPGWTPPSWAFPVVWTSIFALLAVAAGRGWTQGRSAAERRRLLELWAANGLLNIAWSVLFFRFRRPDWALAEVAALWLSILALAAALRPVSRLAYILTWPYLAWVTLAAVLNGEVVRLNAPFGR